MSAKSRAGRSSAGGSSVPRPPRAPPRRRWACRWPCRRCGARRSSRAVCSAASANSSPWISTTGSRILADELELGHRQSPVERQEDGAQPPAGELQLEDVGVVHAEDRHPVAARDPEGAGEPQGGARDALVERGIGEASAGGEIMRRFGARREARVMGDPVFRGDSRRHAFPFPVCPQVGLQMSAAARGWPGVAGFSGQQMPAGGRRVSAQHGAQKLAAVFLLIKYLTVTKVLPIFVQTSRSSP